MPLHLLGKKSWNVYNPANIARVRADEAAAAAREAAQEQRMQELDAERRIAILRGVTPPPLPEEEPEHSEKAGRRAEKSELGHDRKRRRLAGEDDTDRDIRLAKAATAPREDDTSVVTSTKSRKPTSNAPLTDHAGHINLFPVDERGARKGEKNAEAEAERKRKERELEDQYTMRFSNAAGKSGLEKPWYAAPSSADVTAGKTDAAEDDNGKMIDFTGGPGKDVWGNNDPRRKDREKMRMSAQRDRKKWAEEKEREIRELKAAREKEDRRERHSKRKSRHEDDEKLENFSLDGTDPSKHGSRRRDKEKLRHRHHRSRSRSRDRRREHDRSHRSRRRSRSRSKSRDRSRERTSHHRSKTHREGRDSRNERRNESDVARA
ncbi:hypothetical protein AOQ84DRAFT_391221 [Glonium stellatum]|uniref:CBF1-interacting co-repressor CIR N-terminal domain-containing protein n=1 Tax=Glonium stellatum TaxID=574774 RepID=A0A8E2JPM1_9PEZI|nr:hypothetical protein AOQ84DRAFT_391221 [Glonium stellatum]